MAWLDHSVCPTRPTKKGFKQLNADVYYTAFYISCLLFL
jgi:hypothetical protein